MSLKDHQEWVTFPKNSKNIFVTISGSSSSTEFLILCHAKHQES